MKRWLLCIVVATILSQSCLFQGCTAGAAVILSDSFEDGNLASWNQADQGWTIVNSAIGAHSGSKRAQLTGPTDPVAGSALIKLISTEGHKDIVVDIFGKINNKLEPQDIAQIFWFSGLSGQIRKPLVTLTNAPTGDWVNYSFSLPVEANNNSSFGLGVSGLFDSGSDAFSVDDIIVTGTPIPEPASVAAFGLLIPLFLRRVLN